FGAHVVMPEGGYRHWPLGNLWRLMDIRKEVLASTTSTMCTPRVDSPLTILIVKRSRTKLSGFTSSWYETLGRALLQDESVLRSVMIDAPLLRIRMFDDRDARTMGSFAEQVRAFNEADVIIGAHGAGLSLIMFAKPCAHVI